MTLLPAVTRVGLMRRGEGKRGVLVAAGVEVALVFAHL
jgi:hypothetical protein